MGNLSEFQISKTVSAKYSFLLKFYVLCVLLSFIFVLSLFGGYDSLYVDLGYSQCIEKAPSGYYYSSNYYIGNDYPSSQYYRVALEFNLAEIPQNAIIETIHIIFYSGIECGINDGVIKFTKIPSDWPDYWDQLQTLYYQISNGTLIGDKAIDEYKKYSCLLSNNFVDSVQVLIESGGSIVGIGAYNQYEYTYCGTSFDDIDCQLKVCYTFPAPPAPTNLRVTSKTSGSMILAWSAPGGEVTGYKVYKNGALYGTTTNTTKQICNLNPGYSYTFYVKAYNDYGDGDASSSINESTFSSVISGPVLVCTTESYSVNNVPSGSTLTWTPPSNLTLVSGQHENPCIFQKYSNGNGSIVAEITSGCENYSLSKQVHTGPYSSSDYPISGPSSAQCESWVSYSIPQLAGVTSINWVWPQEWTYYSGQGTRYLALITGQYSGMVLVGVNNECGQSGSYASKYTSIHGYCGYFLLISPNPASDVVNVTINEPEESVTLINDTLLANKMEVVEKPESFKIIITNNMGVIYYSETEYNKTFTLPVQKLRNGNYIVIVDYGKVRLSASLVVKH